MFVGKCMENCIVMIDGGDTIMKSMVISLGGQVAANILQTTFYVGSPNDRV